ncbi:hypothetical protein QQP08_013508 [Theobroma cacao]|nr:hypothetical protein QQP08_013508 [Theobroma cacao]
MLKEEHGVSHGIIIIELYPTAFKYPASRAPFIHLLENEPYEFLLMAVVISFPSFFHCYHKNKREKEAGEEQGHARNIFALKIIKDQGRSV